MPPETGYEGLQGFQLVYYDNGSFALFDLLRISEVTSLRPHDRRLDLLFIQCFCRTELPGQNISGTSVQWGRISPRQMPLE